MISFITLLIYLQLWIYDKIRFHEGKVFSLSMMTFLEFFIETVIYQTFFK